MRIKLILKDRVTHEHLASKYVYSNDERFIEKFEHTFWDDPSKWDYRSNSLKLSITDAELFYSLPGDNSKNYYEDDDATTY